MSKTQLAALQSYVSAVVRLMTDHMGAHTQNVALYLTSRAILENEFGKDLPEYPDLLSLPAPAPQPPAMPDLL